MRVFLSNLGCKLNQAELEALGRQFVDAGYSVAPALAEADLHVVNTCTVTHAAARDSRKLARRGRRLNPHLKTVLTGCYVTAEPEEAAALAGVDLVVANRDKDELVGRVRGAFEDAVREVTAPLDIPYVPLEFGNSRALVKIEDGCDMNCAFCIIPITRGHQHSRDGDSIVREVESLVAKGFHEIVLTGVQISSYRAAVRRGERGGLFELVCRLLEETSVGRLRLTSIAPWQFDRRLLELLSSGVFSGVSSGRLCRHLHLSLQSGCDATLERMGRPYTTGEFAALVDEIRNHDPAVQDVALTTDVIVGFPGETDSEFEESLAFCSSIGFARIHAFPYSPRPGTEAATLPDPVRHEIKKKRMARLLEVASQAERHFLQSQIGLEAEVLWESQRQGVWSGVTDNYVRAVRRTEADLGGLASQERLRSLRGNAIEVDSGWERLARPASISFVEPAAG
ncbi:MAG: tRNA (N(6)-L-threonylcarbamoyladenosine(37)-C(2))-methylthiotransferase MtaB [Acidobacteriota bacterium]|nr:tRNA (N(6)-L-threonylcarbamoyladenosine(37)-C(2))-methylthiotransferase MtaB [Acidobacteriota bacterium]